MQLSQTPWPRPVLFLKFSLVGIFLERLPAQDLKEFQRRDCRLSMQMSLKCYKGLHLQTPRTDKSAWMHRSLCFLSFAFFICQPVNECLFYALEALTHTHTHTHNAMNSPLLLSLRGAAQTGNLAMPDMCHQIKPELIFRVVLNKERLLSPKNLTAQHETSGDYARHWARYGLMKLSLEYRARTPKRCYKLEGNVDSTRQSCSYQVEEVYPYTSNSHHEMRHSIYAIMCHSIANGHK